MYTILKSTCKELVVEHSRFIAIVCHVESPQLVKSEINNIKKEYPKARHYCYAYSIGGNKKSSDDGEPSGTAGRPLLELLNVMELDEVLIVVVRYFGGVLLGAARLLRTYVESAKMALESSEKFIKQLVHEWIINCDYSFVDDVKNYLKAHNIMFLKMEFDELAHIFCQSSDDISKEIINCFHGKIDVKKSEDKIAYVLEEK